MSLFPFLKARGERRAGPPGPSVAQRYDGCLSIAHSETGPVRMANEDRFLAMDKRGLWLVADGMGGHRDGERAAQSVIDAVSAVAASGDTAILDAVRRANQALYREGQTAGMMGATVCLLLISQNVFSCYWAGDCRMYRLRDSTLKQLTNDHSEVSRMVAAGLLTTEEARAHPNRNVVTRAVGVSDIIELDRTTGAVERGDTFLICTDGLSDAIEEQRLSLLLQSRRGDIAKALVRQAIESGSTDNVTAVVVEAL